MTTWPLWRIHLIRITLALSALVTHSLSLLLGKAH
jgi:hypothetical protein